LGRILNSLHKQEGLGRRVLVVEDDRTAREATRRFLQFCGHEVEVAPDPESALEAARQVAPDVVVCDCNLEEKLDGIPLAKSIQDRHRSAVIFVTAYPRSALEECIHDLWVTDCLRKPISLSDLAESVSGAKRPVPGLTTAS